MSARLTIAHVLTSFGLGGAERVALDLAAEQRKLGHRVMAVSLAPDHEGVLGAEFREREVLVHTVVKRPGIDVTLPPRLARLFRAESVDVVHTHNPAPLIYAAGAGRAIGAAVIHTKHGEGHMGSRGQKILRRLTSRFADVFVAVSERTAEQARAQRACPPGRLMVIINGIALSRFYPGNEARDDIRAALGVGLETCLVGTVGRIDWNKNQAGLVRALAPILGPALQLVIVGDGPEIASLRAAVASTCPNFVHVLGRRMDVNAILSALDVFALYSLSEGLPLVIPEAMACGLPVVTSAVGGIPDVVIDGETGYLVGAEDDAALRERITALAGDRALGAALGATGRKRALAVYSAETMCQRYLEQYELVLRKRRARR